METISAYENFINFLLDENSYIDYTFLWDIVCIPNPRLFPSGLNLAILKIVENDMRDNIELICPTSTYSSVYYDNKKPTFIYRTPIIPSSIFTYHIHFIIKKRNERKSQ